LTIKSIETHVAELHETGKLVHHSKVLWPDQTCLRRLWLHPNVHEWAQSDGATRDEEKYFAGVRAVFSDFVRGEDFDDEAEFKEITKGPNGKFGIWEIKISFFPHWRVLGGFLRVGEFVALSHGNRALLAQHGFEPLIQVVRGRWEQLFTDRPMLRGLRPDLLGNYNGGL
jgi:hypothetical protein